MNELTWRRFRRAVHARRRLVAAILVGLAVLFGLSALRPPLPPTVAVLSAARDLAAGSALALTDLRTVALPAGAVPAGTLRPGADVLGRVVAGPVRRGEPLTDVRLVGPSLLAAVAPGPDVVAVPVRFADEGAAAVLRPGDRIDVLAARAGAPFADPPLGDMPAGGGSPPPARAPTGPEGVAARVVAADVLVVLVASPSLDAGTGGAGPAGPGTPAGDGTLVVVVCTPDVARALAAAAATDRLSPTLRRSSPAVAPPEPTAEPP